MTIGMGKLQRKTACMAGGRTGAGFAAAQLFIREGARVGLLGQDEARAAAAAGKFGRKSVRLRPDAGLAADMRAVVARVQPTFGQLDIAVASAGIVKPVSLPNANADTANIDDQISVSLTGATETMKKRPPISRRSASIVFISATPAGKSIAHLGLNSATKDASRSLAHTLWSGLRGEGIRVNVVAPGLIDTPVCGKPGMAVRLRASDEFSYFRREDLLVDVGMAAV